MNLNPYTKLDDIFADIVSDRLPPGWFDRNGVRLRQILNRFERAYPPGSVVVLPAPGARPRGAGPAWVRGVEYALDTLRALPTRYRATDPLAAYGEEERYAIKNLRGLPEQEQRLKLRSIPSAVLKAARELNKRAIRKQEAGPRGSDYWYGVQAYTDLTLRALFTNDGEPQTADLHDAVIAFLKGS